MSGVRFVTREIGSLAKPSWRVKAFAGRPLEESDFAAAEEWGRRLEVKGHEALVEGLRGESLNLPDIDDWAAIYAIRLLERVGLDVVYDGEQKRTEMYDHVAAFARGFEPRGTVRSFDNKYYAKAAVVEAPSVPGPQDVEEFEFVRAHTDRVVKVPLTGAYTMEDWSYDEHYGHEGGLGVLDIHSDFVEPAELVRDRILYAVEVLGDPGRIQVNPDCGLRTRSWDVVYEKLATMVQGTRLAEDALG